MELDDLKQAWSAQFADLEQRLEQRLEQHREQQTRRDLQRTLLPATAWSMLELALTAALLAVIAMPVLSHLDDLRYLIVGGITLLTLGVTIVLLTVRAVQALRLDLRRPVLAIQGDLNRLQRTESVAFLWTLCGGIMIWLPLALLLFEAATGVPALQRVHQPWLLANVLLGVVLLATVVVLARWRAATADGSSWLDRAATHLSGRSLRRASAQPAELRHFAATPDK